MKDFVENSKTAPKSPPVDEKPAKDPYLLSSMKTSLYSPSCWGSRFVVDEEAGTSSSADALDEKTPLNSPNEQTTLKEPNASSLKKKSRYSSYTPAPSLDSRGKSRRKRHSVQFSLPTFKEQQQKSTTPAQRRWAKLRTYVLTGRFLVDGGTGIGDARPSTLRRRHSSFVRRFRHEIQHSTTLSVWHCVTAIGGYLLLAVVTFHFWLDTDWTIVDCCYFAVITFTTIGFGDLVPPDDPVARLVTCGFALLGVSFMGLAIGALGNHLVELEKSAMERAQSDVLSLFPSSSSELDGGSDNNNMFANDSSSSINSERDFNGYYHCNKAVGSVYPQMNRRDDPGETVNAFHISKVKRRLPRWWKNNKHLQWAVQFSSFIIGLFGICYLIGKESGWDASNTLYFAITTASTIGYGDEVPTTQSGRLLVVLFVPFAVAAMGFFLQLIAETIMKRRQKQGLFHRVDLKCTQKSCRELTIMDLEAMDTDGNNEVDWGEFLQFMLVAMKKVDEELLFDIRSMFDRLDHDGSGCLNKDGLIIMAKRKLQATENKLRLLDYKQKLMKKKQQPSFRDNNRTQTSTFV